ncbi:ankyrin [Hypoxylon cercidicola]|nr:ankyrin [Hypoxylon cercidicola]
MPELQAFPNEIFTSIINQLVISVGIYKAVRLRSVNRAFNSAILYAICVVQVVDINDPATPDLARRMLPQLKAQIVLKKSVSDESEKDYTLFFIAKLNQVLDHLTRANGERQIEQHRRIAEAAAHKYPNTRLDMSSPHRCDDVGPQNVLCGAVILGDLELVKTLLKQRSDAVANIPGYGLPKGEHAYLEYIQESSYLGWPLRLAATWGHNHLVCYFLEHGADPHVGWDYYTRKGDWEPNMYVGVGMANVCREQTGSTLRAAVLGNHEDVVQTLLQPKHRISPSDAEYFRIIVAAGKVGNISLVHTLIEATGKSLQDFPGVGEEIMWHAVYNGHYRVVQMALDSGVDVNAAPIMDCRNYGCALSIAASLGNTRMVRFLLDHGADASFSHDAQSFLDPIEIAANHGHIEVVELLLARGADPKRAFRRAADGGQAHMIQWLSDRDPSLLSRPSVDRISLGMEAMLRAVLRQNAAVISLLVKLGVPLSEGYRYTSSEPPIVVAKRIGADWIVDLLLSLGAKDEDVDFNITKQYNTKVERGGILVTKRTWEWVGKY